MRVLDLVRRCLKVRFPLFVRIFADIGIVIGKKTNSTFCKFPFVKIVNNYIHVELKVEDLREEYVLKKKNDNKVNEQM